MNAYEDIVYSESQHGALEESVKYDWLYLRVEIENQIVLPGFRPREPHQNDADYDMNDSPENGDGWEMRLIFSHRRCDSNLVCFPRLHASVDRSSIHRFVAPRLDSRDQC